MFPTRVCDLVEAPESRERLGELRPAASTSALRLRGLYKQFGDQVVVDHLSSSLPAGAVLEIVGGRSAGKSTLVAMVGGLLPPDEGVVEVFGIDIWAAPALPAGLVGLLPDDAGLPGDVVGRDWLRWVGLSRGMAAATLARRMETVVRQCGLRGLDGGVVGRYTPGMRKRLQLAAALLDGPRLLLLDEPFAQVDALSAALMQTVLTRYRADGGTVVLTSPAVAEVGPRLVAPRSAPARLLTPDAILDLDAAAARG